MQKFVQFAPVLVDFLTFEMGRIPQCDQMVKLCFTFCPFATKKLAQKFANVSLLFSQIRINLPKAYKILPKW